MHIFSWTDSGAETISDQEHGKGPGVKAYFEIGLAPSIWPRNNHRAFRIGLLKCKTYVLAQINSGVFGPEK